MIDSATKRYSALQFGDIWGMTLPTGTIDQAARQDLLALYRGILANTPIIITYVTTETIELPIVKEDTIYASITKENTIILLITKEDTLTW